VKHSTDLLAERHTVPLQ